MRSESDGPAGEAEAAGLLEALTSDDEAARRQAIQGAVQLGERAVPLLPELQRLAREDPSVEIRFLCTRALDAIAQAAGPSRQAPGARKSTGSTRLLALEPAETLAVKLESPDVNLRASALRACALKQDRTVLPALLERASPERELDPELRALACRVTGILGGGATLDAIGRFGDDPDARVRLTAVEVFAQLPSVTSFGYVAVALMDPDERVVRGAATVLRTLGPLNIPRLGQAMLRAQEVRFRRAAVHLLRATALPAAVPLLASTLSDPDPAVREAAQAALVQLAARGIAGAAEAVPAGAPPATPLSGSVPLVAAPAPPPEAPPRPALPLDDIASADPRERRRAAATLAGLDAPDESVVPQLLQRVKLETDASTSGHLIRAVVMAKGRGALEAVLPMLTDRQSVVRASAVDALGQIGTPEAIDAAVPLLADPDPQVVGRAVLTLRLHRKIDISKIIDDLAVRPDPRFRRVAVSTASLLGDERFRAVLGRLAEDPDAETARLAAAALTLLERQRGGEAVTLPPTAPARSRSGALRLASARPPAGPASITKGIGRRGPSPGIKPASGARFKGGYWPVAPSGSGAFGSLGSAGARTMG